MNPLIKHLSMNKELDKCLIELTIEKNCDLVVLAEYPAKSDSLCNHINLISEHNYIPVPALGGCNKIKAIMKSEYRIHILHEQTRYQILLWETALYKLIIAMVHNISKLHSTEEDQAEVLRQLHNDLLQLEQQQGTNNILIIGDLNVNPFEKSCVAADTIHAIPYAHELKWDGRKIQERLYKEFYNPMWKLLGRKEAPFGTYYYNSGKVVNYFWHIFDQCLVRPELADALDEESLEIVIQTKSHHFLKSTGKPNAKSYSDHLPVFVKLKEELIP